jgi:hypothetical protein
VVNKLDRPAEWEPDALDRHGWAAPPVKIAALPGTGMELLHARILEALGLAAARIPTLALITPRQVAVAEEALGLITAGKISQAGQKIYSELIGPLQDSGLKGCL